MLVGSVGGPTESLPTGNFTRSQYTQPALALGFNVHYLALDLSWRVLRDLVRSVETTPLSRGGARRSVTPS